MRCPCLPSLLLLAVGSALALPPACAAGVPHPRKMHKKDMRGEIEDLEQQWRTAQLSGDVAMMDKLLSDDFVGISVAGQVNTKTSQLDHVRNRKLVITRYERTDTKIKLVGSVAIVTSLLSVQGTSDGNSITGQYRYTRVYQHLPSGAWKITNFESTRVPVHDVAPPDRASSATN